MTNLKGCLFLLMAIVCFNSQQVKAQFRLSGYVKDAQTGENLIGANVYNAAALIGSSANTYGYFSLNVPTDSISLIVSYVGYASQQLFIRSSQDSIINVMLQPASALSEVVVKGSRPQVQLTKMSSMTINAQEIKNIPALMGEVDVLKAIQLMPGIQSGTEGSSGIYVRGGGPDQNLILLDGVPVYNASHLFGFFSVFNADAINSVEVIKGGFPARYGGRLSSVIDINMKEGNMQHWQADGGIGLIASRLSVEGPLVKGKSSIIISGRRTYADVIAKPFIRASSGGDTDIGYYFYDLNAKANYIFSDKDRLYVSAYTGTDRFRVLEKYRGNYGNSRDEAGIYWGNVTFATRWNHLINPSLFMNTTATYSRYGFNLYSDSESEYDYDDGNGPEVEKFYAEYNSGIQDYGFRTDFDYFPSNKHNVKFGAQYIYHIFQPEAFNLEGDFESDPFSGLNPPIYGNEYMLYAEDEFDLTKKLKVNTGLNASAFYVQGKWYNSLQPRFSARYMLQPNLSVKASYAHMAQYLHLLTNSGLGLPTDLWVPATDKIKPQLSRQVAVGLNQSLADDAYELSIESYYKEMDNLIEYKPGANFINVTEDWEEKVVTGKGWSYGVEFLARKKVGDFTGWIGYTLSWNNRQFDELNFGKVFPYKYDRRHDISTVLNYKFSKRFEMNATWVYGTGNALTVPIAKYPSVLDDEQDFYGNPVYQYSERNAYRMPSYHRADIGLSFIKQKKWGEAIWNVSIYNVYNRQNPFYVAIQSDFNGNEKFVQYSLLQIIPSISYSFKIRPQDDK